MASFQRRYYAGGATGTTLASSMSSTDTTFTLTSSTGWPGAASNDFIVVIDRGTSSEEKILCSSNSGTTVTVATRGFDGTSAQAHNAGATVYVSGGAIDFDETNQVSNLLGNAAEGSLLYGKGTGALSAELAIGASGTILGSNGTDPVWDSLATLGIAPVASPTFTGTTTAPEFSASGLTGATAASRYVGATTSGAPTTGTFAVGDFVIDQTGKVWVCTTAGTPGTWTQIGGGVPVTPRAGTWWPNYLTGAGTTFTPTVGVLYSYPMVVTAKHTYVAIGFNTTVLGTAAIVRLGIYKDNGGTPVGGALVLDAGTITETLGANTITISQSLAPGVYWLVGVVNSATTAPTFTADSGSNNGPVFGFASVNAASGVNSGLASTASTYTGALPATFPAAGISGSVPIVLLQA